MNWAFFADVHGNLEALEEVVGDFSRQGVTRSFFIGDAVGYGPSPNECLKIITELTEVRLLGNHDEAALENSVPNEFNKHARTAIFWTRENLTTESRTMLQSFTITETIDEFRLVHASPAEPRRWDYILNPVDAAAAFRNFTESACFIGHTHQPGIFQKTKRPHLKGTPAEDLVLDPQTRYLINVGSVGQPRDGDSRACYVLYDPDTRHLKYRRVPYDFTITQEKMRAAGRPEFLVARLKIGR